MYCPLFKNLYTGGSKWENQLLISRLISPGTGSLSSTMVAMCSAKSSKDCCTRQTHVINYSMVIVKEKYALSIINIIILLNLIPWLNNTHKMTHQIQTIKDKNY